MEGVFDKCNQTRRFKLAKIFTFSKYIFGVARRATPWESRSLELRFVQVFWLERRLDATRFDFETYDRKTALLSD